MNVLYAVLAITLVCLAGIIALAFVGKAIPESLTATVTAGVGFLVGSAATAISRKQ